jgi:hypothetical protein
MNIETEQGERYLITEKIMNEWINKGATYTAVQQSGKYSNISLL